MAHVLLAAYFVVLGLLALLGLHRLVLTALALGRPPRREPPLPPEPPAVLVQLPLYNEPLVVERLLHAVAALRYPAGRWHLQVLDDSTDETRLLVDRTVEVLARRGVPVSVLRREGRAGYKAGALAAGLSGRTEELVAIFDADFLPEPDFLLRTAPWLAADPGLGLVQARWGHTNRDRSLLTRAQGVFLDAHFAIEHQARDRAGHCFNFNGTAGVWRRRAIEEAGGWSADTITEDLDLSYRAQLAGWRFRYLDHVVVPAELPESFPAFRGQQARWVRGSVETARKLGGRVLSAPGLSIRQRIDALVHLTQNFAYLLMAALAVLLPAAVLVRGVLGWRVPGGEALLSGLDTVMLAAGTSAVLLFYGAALVRTGQGLGPRRALDLLLALAVGAGMCLGNAQEVLRGLRSSRSVFVRTPKRGQASPERALRLGEQRPERAGYPELAFAAYFLLALAHSLSEGRAGPLPFLAIYAAGFLLVGLSRLPRAPRASLPLPAEDAGEA